MNVMTRLARAFNTCKPRWALLVALCLIVTLGTPGVRAQTAVWSSGGITSQWGLNCSIIGQNYGEIMLQSYASWLHYSDYSAPKTGDVSYVSLVMSVPGLNCDGNSSVGFIPELFLPPGASLSISPSTPVKCFFSINGSSSSPFTGTQIGNMSGTLRVGPLCPDGQGGGVGTPFLVGSANGPNGGLALGSQYFPRTSMLEIQIPLRFAKPLNGTSDKVQFTTYGSTIYDGYNSGTGQFLGDGTALHEVPILIGYRPLFGNAQSSAVTATSAHVATDLSSFYTAGTAYVDYGLTTSYGSSLTIGAVPNTGEQFNVYADLTGLSPGTLYNWRIRYVTALGTFSGSNQTFTTGAAANQSLSVTKNGTGAGTVSSAPAGINCGATCTASFAQGSTVTLTAAPSSGSQFLNWGGACAGSTLTCTVTMNAAVSVTASFMREIGSLSYTVSGLPAGTSATLNITGPDAQNFSKTVLTGTGQTLSDVVTGAYTVTAPNITVGSTTYVPNQVSQTVTVSFGGNPTVNVVYSAQAPTSYALSVTKNGAGSGSVSSAPAGIDCGTTCAADFSSGSSVTLTAAPASGSSFTGWSGACTGTGTCVLTMNAAQSVTASFALNPPPSYALSVTKNGTGTGAVSSNPTGINCGATCTANFNGGSSISLTATPDTGSVFVSWGGACSGNGSCVVTLSAAQAVTATFDTAPVNTFALTVTKAGTGSGSVSSAPSGIDCGASCSASFTQNTSVTLTASPASGSALLSWGGACAGSALTCTVTMDAAKTVTASFNTTTPSTYALSLGKTGTGTGSVSSSPAGVNCGSVCTANFAAAASVTLTATADAGSSFTGWSGACAGTGSCTVTMDAAKSVTASFTLNTSNVAATAGTNPPADRSMQKGSSNNAALAFALTLPNGKLSSLQLSVSGTGNDATDLTSVKLFVDANANGLVDANETALATGQFNADNGALSLTPATALTLANSGATQFLVAVDVNTTLAAWRFVPALSGLLLLGLGLRRRWLAALGLMVLLTACPAPPVVPETRTYQIKLEAVSLKNSSNAVVTVTGLPLSGATLSVQK